MRRRRAVGVLRDETGNTATSAVVAIAALVFGVMITGTAVGLVGTTSATNNRAVLSAAVDQRLAAYADALDAGASATTGAVCYPPAGACASIAGVVAGAAQRTVTLDAMHGDSTSTEVRVLDERVGSHIVGFDALDDPVWASVAGATTFTGWQ